jgi:hypothetical protein
MRRTSLEPDSRVVFFLLIPDIGALHSTSTRLTLQAFDLIHELVEHPSILSEFGYSAEQAAFTVRQLGRFAGTRVYSISLRTTLCFVAQLTFALGFRRRRLSWYRYCSS